MFVLAMAGIIVRPRDLPEAVFALAGGAVMLITGFVPPVQSLTTIASHWNVFLFFLGLFTISSVADLAGIFDWLALFAARISGGSSRRLLINVFLIGAVVSAFLSNDATVLILTPVVLTLTTRLGLPTRPYVFACAFVANAASFTLPVSNPVNIIVLTTFPAALPAYLAHLLPAAALSVAINLAAFLWLFRQDVRGRFDILAAISANGDQSQPAFFRAVAGWLAATCVVYILAAIWEFPLGVVAAGSGVGLVAIAQFSGKLRWRRLGREISWSLFGLVAGLLVLVDGLANTGVLPALARLLSLGGSQPFASAFVAVATAALGSNLVNNLPATFVLTASIGHVADASIRGALAYGTIVGADLGPNITIVGSLSTMLWLLILRRNDVDVSALEFARLGAPVTLITLLCATTLLALASG